MVKTLTNAVRGGSRQGREGEEKRKKQKGVYKEKAGLMVVAFGWGQRLVIKLLKSPGAIVEAGGGKEEEGEK